jgi:putative ABC transport system substrate-binding protein
VELKCHVIFAVGPEAPVRALQNAQAPAIVFVAVDYDPLERGVITSLRTPDRNTTGVYVPQDALAVKRLQIMREVMPDARRFLVFSDSFSRDQLAALRVAADRAGLQLTVVEFSRPPYDFASAMESGRRAKVEAFVGLTSPIFANRGDDIAQALHEHRIPGAAWNAVPGVMKAGFVFGYGDDPAKVGRKGAEIGARILKGAKPADIPVEQADQFDFFINSAVAQQLGVNIPESLRARATRFVQ